MKVKPGCTEVYLPTPFGDWLFPQGKSTSKVQLFAGPVEELINYVLSPIPVDLNHLARLVIGHKAGVVHWDETELVDCFMQEHLCNLEL